MNYNDEQRPDPDKQLGPDCNQRILCTHFPKQHGTPQRLLVQGQHFLYSSSFDVNLKGNVHRKSTLPRSVKGPKA